MIDQNLVFFVNVRCRYYKVKNTQVDILNRAFLILWMNAFNSCTGLLLSLEHIWCVTCVDLANKTLSLHGTTACSVDHTNQAGLLGHIMYPN